ncbi:RNA polymerase sigma factor SigY [Paenibacillus sacheonensis]|uniref:RNA polymerase sigma factor n=1 Tax=Paenibacillus sacheonensis TaxID=742054 RepID=A0A7X4YP40_9BACL|nr:RNA polymerase sigma factor SigY [Paenibacillus sacheonensis]MBM7565301.1 RNA polymerase sigma-70 factor (ECF subfamily) [Paenibacillus sacheonensis]NBC69928.1 RNA polymerase sigma factor SigY [Paenibacillus sacheonensis]
MSSAEPHPDEERLIARAVRGDDQALADLLRHHYAFLYRYMLKITMNKPMAEDLVQDTMLKAIERIGGFESRSKLSTWLISVGTRLYIDEMRKAQRSRRWQSEEQALQGIRFQAALQQQEWPDALEALGGLQYEQRVPILLKYYYGYAYEEIADWMNIPVGTVKSRLHNGLGKLRKELKTDEET